MVAIAPALKKQETEREKNSRSGKAQKTQHSLVECKFEQRSLNVNLSSEFSAVGHRSNTLQLDNHHLHNGTTSDACWT